MQQIKIKNWANSLCRHNFDRIPFLVKKFFVQVIRILIALKLIIEIPIKISKAIEIILGGKKKKLF